MGRSQQKVLRLALALGVLFSLAPLASGRQPEPRSYAPAQPVASATTATPQFPPFNVPAELPVLSEEVIPLPSDRPVFYREGVLVETLDGQGVWEQAADQAFNPASAIKLATALVALRTLGARYRFATAVWVDGAFDQATQTVNGDLIISGRDPSLHYEHAVEIAQELNKLGIRTVTGDLIVAPRFTMNFSPSSLRSGESFYDTLDSARRPAAATRAWYDTRAVRKDTRSLQTTPGVAVMGAVYVDSVPQTARVVSTHYSSQLVDVLKVLLCYSNNFMAERLGDTMGGAAAIKDFLTREVGLPAEEVRVATASGLGTNRLTPRQMLKVYRALLDELAKERLDASAIMPVAGVDPGTLQKRYAAQPNRGSIIAKTGTLPRTDGGASALVGQMRTQSGELLLFVIFHQRGSVTRFRAAQDALLAQLQYARGGPAPFAYDPHMLAMRLADTEFDSAKSAATDEYEPTPK